MSDPFLPLLNELSARLEQERVDVKRCLPPRFNVTLDMLFDKLQKHLLGLALYRTPEEAQGLTPTSDDADAIHLLPAIASLGGAKTIELVNALRDFALRIKAKYANNNNDTTTSPVDHRQARQAQQQQLQQKADALHLEMRSLFATLEEISNMLALHRDKTASPPTSAATTTNDDTESNVNNQSQRQVAASIQQNFSCKLCGFHSDAHEDVATHVRVRHFNLTPTKPDKQELQQQLQKKDKKSSRLELVGNKLEYSTTIANTETKLQMQQQPTPP